MCAILGCHLELLLLVGREGNSKFLGERGLGHLKCKLRDEKGGGNKIGVSLKNGKEMEKDFFFFLEIALRTNRQLIEMFEKEIGLLS